MKPRHLRLLKEKLKQYAGPIIVILAILAAYLPFYLHGGFIGDLGDPIGQTIPNKFLLTQYLKNGLMPLWNPFTFLGMPFLADIQVGAFYFPDTIIFSLFSPFTALNISILFHLIIGGLGCYLLLKKLSKSTISSTVGALMLALTGAFLTRVVYLNFLETISLIPWILLAISSKKNIITKVSLLFALMIFAGHPVAAFYAVIVITIFTLFYHFRNKKILLKTTAAILLGLLISSIQLIPFYALKTESLRDHISYEDFVSGSLNKASVVSMINPFAKDFQYSIDLYFNIGIISLLLLIISPFFFKKFSKELKKLYFAGLILIIVGLIFSLGKNISPFYKILYYIPPFNLTRVPARYLVITQFGAVFSLVAFLSYLIIRKRKTAIALSLLVIINSILLPSIFLKQNSADEFQKQYHPEIKAAIEKNSTDKFSLFEVPKYTFNDQAVGFPNRQVLNFFPNPVGYNPLTPKNIHSILPMASGGYFADKDYFEKLYEKFIQVGLKYYIFPKTRSETENFLKLKKWEILTTIGAFNVWQNPSPTAFAYFENHNNKITNIDFRPGKITIEADMTTPDNLIVNQSYFPGWEIKTDKAIIRPELYQNLIQLYKIPQKTAIIELSYKPKDYYYGLYLTIIGLAILIVLNIKKRYSKIIL